MKGDSDHGVELLRRASLGDRQAFADLFTLHRPGLHDMIRLRLDDRLKARIDPSDVLQETFLEADRRLKEYVSHPKMPFLLWLRFIARQKILALHRHHLGVLARDPRREIRLDAGSCTGTNSVAIADGLLGWPALPRCS
jgi:RNA polymerase sigma-70 factor (ECF subfamily)